MENKEKQIEEMAKIISNARDTYYGTSAGDGYYVPTEYYAKVLLEQGYRQCKDKVVLTREEWETVCENLSNAESQGRKINYFYGELLIENQVLKEKLDRVENEARKETAEKILKEWAETDKETGGFNLPYIYELAKQFGVEIKE